VGYCFELIIVLFLQHDIQPGDCLEELYGQYIDERWCVRIGQLKRKHQGKPIAVTIVKVLINTKPCCSLPK